MMVTLTDIRDILQKHRARYKHLDILAQDLEDLPTDPSRFRSTSSPNVYDAQVGDAWLRTTLFPADGVARFELAEDPGLPSGAVGGAAGAAIGAALARMTHKDAPTGAIYGLLVGAMLGVAADSANPPREVLTLKFSPSEGGWRLYHGPYVAWAQEALLPRARSA